MLSGVLLSMTNIKNLIIEATAIDVPTASTFEAIATANKIAVTPEIARQWLLNNVHNRPVSATTVEKYRINMIAGQWKYAADPIRFAIGGNLLDGQHRLIALAGIPDEVGIAVPFLVVRGLPQESQKYMDQGSKRGAGQQR